ncbi:hypothetical protein PENSTE_c015G09514 [Penicillium steckii]|uniref:Zn(2)-C6 fungal-type domain-containing protein n=1 Tax=Penicillium steckii TaxID=303698 RepID=A0A1V6SZC6_9EURO|nr:hypothetical protein PENSTE_c015G09514 [Penicillium steckii]
MGPRRTHKKSRNGCQSCKTRKVKCDEGKPRCNNCIKHGADCDFASQAASSAAATPSMPLVNENLSELSIESPTPGIAISDMALLHHYSTSTCYTISRHPVLQSVWQITIPQYGFTPQSQFVFRGILALAALHMSHIRPDMHEKYVATAEYHHNMALKMVSAAIPQINEESGPALYVFSTITCIITCAMRRNSDEFWVSNDAFFEWLGIVRGTKAIISSVVETLRSGPLAPMFTLGRRKRIARETRSTENQPFMTNLRRLITESVNNQHELECYLEALDDMAKSFAAVYDTQSVETADVFIWLYQISEEYLDLLRQRTPEALVIFGYFCVITKELEWTWWMQGFSVHLMRAIYYHLDQEHRYWLQWPMQQLGWVPWQSVPGEIVS